MHLRVSPQISPIPPYISQADRELKVRLEATQAELTSTRKVNIGEI